jgi:hypothetical protein
MIITLYDILGISSTASSAEIKTAYKKLAKQYHPDKNPGSNWHEEQFKKVNQAYQILSDPSQRQVYDYRLEYERFNQQRPVTPKPPPQQQRTPPTSKTQTQYNYQKKKQESQYQKPPSVQETWLDKFFETIFRPIKSLSEKKINMYVVSYYFFSVMLLGSYYEFLDSTKTTELFELAEIHAQKGEYHDAVSAYNAILSIDAENKEAYEKRAFLKMKINWDTKNILDDLDEAVKYNDNPSDSLLFTRAKYLIKLHRYESALADLDHILLKETEEGERKIDSVYFLKAEINFLFKKYDLAIPDYTSFIKLQPTSGEAHTHRAYCYYDKKIYKAAIYDFNFSIQWHPENAENYYYRAFAKFALKDSSNACKDLHDSFLLGYSDAGTVRNKICGLYDNELY